MVGREGVSLEVTPTQYGVDEVRTPTKVEKQTGNGGEYGEGLLQALQSAGFECARLDGSGLTARQMCYREEREPTPTVQSVGISIIRDEVVRIRANVDIDPAWTAVLDDPDARPSTHRTFEMLIEASIPDGQRPTANSILTRAGQGESQEDPDDPGSARADLASGTVEISMGKSGGQFVFERNTKAEGPVFVDHGLDFVTPKELQTVAEQNGLKCERQKEKLTCSGEGTEMVVEFPVPMSGTQYVTDVEISADKKAPVSAVAQEVAKLVGGKYDQADQAVDWVTGCFGTYTDRTSYAHSEFGCEPGLEGSSDDPDVTGYWFYITRITDY